ncbi:hypothetical protein ACHAWF_007157, partial [Thalassiosira exigua]
ASSDCLRAQKDTVPQSLYHKLHMPYINLGFPKMGTTSLNEYFKCGGLKTVHHKSVCILKRKSAEAGLSPLSLCPMADAYTQIDDGRYFPQI